MRIWLGAAAFVIAAACAPEGDAPDGAPSAEAIAAESERLTAYLNAEFEEELQRSPQWLTQLGRKEQYGQLNDYSEAAADADLAWRRESVAEMEESFDYDLLSNEAKTSYDVWAAELATEEINLPYRRHAYIFGRSGAHTGLPNFMINFHEVSEASDMDAYISRLSQIDDALGTLMERAQLGVDAGVRMPLFAYEKSIDEAQRVVSGAPFSAGEDSPIFADVKSKAAGLVEAGAIDDAQAQAYVDQAETILTGETKPAYDRLVAWLEGDMANAPSGQVGALTLPDGDAYYAARLKAQTTTDMTADEIHELGLAEVARIKAEMETIKEEVAFDGTLEEFFVWVRDADQFHLPNTDEGRAEYIALAEGYLEDMEQKVPEYFGILPKADLEVRRVEAFREEDGGAQHYFSGTPDGSRPGIFYAHLSDMKAMPTYELEAIAYHEGLPGHHMQISIAQELTGLPEFRGQYGHTAYIEGWALYTETLAKEMGGYEDPYSEYGQLSAEIWRAIRLVVDTGIHSKGWTEEEAVQYFLANSSVPEAAVRSEIQRYIVWPGQATAYKIGMIEIQELRAKAQAELGDDFTMAGFHDTVLSGGSLPLPVLERRVDRWIAEVKAGS